MNVVDVQRIYKSPGLPTKKRIQSWVDATLPNNEQDTELVVRIVDEHESAHLNKLYRSKQGPTNILSFPATVPAGIPLNLLGDLVICAPVVEREAAEQNKLLAHHWAHLIIHGVLHLLGYDHIEDSAAEIMENKEINILQKLNISNPYLGVSQ